MSVGQIILAKKGFLPLFDLCPLELFPVVKAIFTVQVCLQRICVICESLLPKDEKIKGNKASIPKPLVVSLDFFFFFFFFSCFQLKSVTPNSLCFTTHPYPSYTRSSCVKSPCTDSCTISGFNFCHSYPPITIGKGLFYEAVSSCIYVHVIEV